MLIRYFIIIKYINYNLSFLLDFLLCTHIYIIFFILGILLNSISVKWLTYEIY